MTATAATSENIDRLWDFQNPDISEQRFRVVGEQARADDNQTLEAIALTQLSRSLGMQGRFEDAHSSLDQAQSLLTPTMNLAHTRYLLERGRVYNSSGDPATSIPLFNGAFELARAHTFEYLAVDAAHMLGIAEQGNTAINWHEKAMVLAESSSDERTRGWLGPLYNNLGWTYNDLGRHGDALTLFEKDIKFRESLGRDFEASIARWSHAKTLRYLGRTEEALESQKIILQNPIRQGKPAEGYSHEEIAECLLLLGRDEEAAHHFKKAYAILGNDTWLQNQEADRLARMNRLSNLPTTNTP